MLILGRCNGNCNTLYDPSCRMHDPNTIEKVNLKVLNIITRTMNQ